MIILEIKFTPDYKANEPIFWSVFKDLSKNNNGLVAYYTFTCAIIFIAVVQAISQMLMNISKKITVT
jgi:hypothetical protein